MKIIYKISFLLLLLLTAMDGFAQDQKSRFSYGLSVTPMIGIHQSDNEQAATFKTNLDGAIVADVYMRLNQRLQIRSGFGIRSVVAEGVNSYQLPIADGPDGSNVLTDVCVDFLSSTRYMTVPLGVKVGLTEKWFANIGLENNFKSQTSGSWTRRPCEDLDSDELIDIDLERYTGIEYLPVLYLGVGFEPSIGENWSLILEPYFDVGLKKSLEQVIGGIVPDYVTNGRLMNFGLRLGVVFNQ